MKLSKIMLIMLAAILVLGSSGCKESKGPRKESVEEYVELAKHKMEEKYSTTFEVVEGEIHDTSFHGMDINTLVLRDNSGILTNVRAKYSTPYNFYDDYADCCAAAKILDQLDYDKTYIESLGITVLVENKSIESIDISSKNIKNATVIAKIPDNPNDANLKAIYDVYETMCAKGYTDIHFFVGFVKESSDFDAAVKNYKFHGKINDSEYNGKFYAQLRVNDPGLSFEEFKLGLKEV